MSVVHVVHKITIQTKKMSVKHKINKRPRNTYTYLHLDRYCVQSQVGLFSRQNTEINL